MKRAKQAAVKRMSVDPRVTAKSASPDRGRRVAVMIALTVLVVVATAILWWRSRPGPMPPNGLPIAGLTTQNMVDSVVVHFKVHEWDIALKWAHEANVSRPGNSNLLLNESLALHNYAQDATQRWPGRSATRTSLDRIELERHSFALMDSALALATTEGQRVNIERWKGTQYEVLGLPFDGMKAYDAALSRSANFQPARLRLGWLQRVVVNPTAPNSVTANDAAPRP